MAAGRWLEYACAVTVVELTFVDLREKIVKFAFSEFELRVDDLFHVETFFILKSISKASFLYIG